MKKKIIIILILNSLITGLLFADAAGEKRSKFIAAAKTYLGVPYVYGGTTRSGMDCSGFVGSAARDAGLSLPRTAAAMYSSCNRISDSDRQAGDLLFFAVGSSITHVGIYLGNGQMIHCASDGPNTGVIISKLTENYWKTHYHSAGRFIAASSSSISTQSSSSSKPSTASKPSSSKPTSKSSANKKLKRASVFINFDGYLDWNFVAPTGDYLFWPKGGTIGAEAQLHLWDMNPGIMVRFTYPIQSYTHFDASTMFNSFNVPLCLTFHMNDYIEFYTGAVLSTGIVCPEPQVLFGTQKTIQPLIYPGIFGVSFRTPRFNINGTYWSFVQDISYTCYKAAEGSEKLTFKEALIAGTTFSTGISITLPF